MYHQQRGKERLMKVTKLITYDVITSQPYSSRTRRTNSNFNRGIIVGVDPEITDEDMSEETGYQVERIIKKKGTTTIRTKQMIVYYQHFMPPFIQYGWRRLRVSIYIPEPVKCFRGQEFGHKARAVARLFGAPGQHFAWGPWSCKCNLEICLNDFSNEAFYYRDMWYVIYLTQFVEACMHAQTRIPHSGGDKFSEIAFSNSAIWCTFWKQLVLFITNQLTSRQGRQMSPGTPRMFQTSE